MSNLPDEIIMKKRRHDDENETENNEDRLSDLPDCVLLHILSFLNTKHVVQACILSTRWKYLWKRIPTLILHSSDFYTEKSFDNFFSKILLLRDGASAVNALVFERHGSKERLFLRKVANYVISHSAHIHRLGISVHGDSCLVMPCISSCRALTSLKLSIYPKGPYARRPRKKMFPKSLNLPALTSLDLTNFAFCASDNAGCAEPFSAFSNLNSLRICSCTVSGAQILSISSETLVNLTMVANCSDFAKFELSVPSFCTFTYIGTPVQKLSGCRLSSIKQVNLDVTANFPFKKPPLVLFSWLLDLPNITSLTVTPNTLLVLYLVPDLFGVEFPSLYNLKSLKVKMEPFDPTAKRLLDDVLLKKSWKEVSKIKKPFEARVELAATTFDRIVGFLCQNSPSAEVHFIDFPNSRKQLIQDDNSLNEDTLGKSQPDTHSPPPDNGL